MPRKEFELTEEQFIHLKVVCRKLTLEDVKEGENPIQARQNKVNAAWMRLGKLMGFRHLTVEFIEGKSQNFFTALTL